MSTATVNPQPVVELAEVGPPPNWRFPLRPCNVPPGSLIRGPRGRRNGGWSSVISCDKVGIRAWEQADRTAAPVTWPALMDGGFDIQVPGDPVWRPAYLTIAELPPHLQRLLERKYALASMVPMASATGLRALQASLSGVCEEVEKEFAEYYAATTDDSCGEF